MFTTDSLYKKQVILPTVQYKVTYVMAFHLLQPFTFQDVFSATKSLIGKDVFPGKDGIKLYFYLNYWDFLGPLLTRAVNLIFLTSNMRTEWTKGTYI